MSSCTDILDTCVCNALRKATRNITNHYDRTLKPAGISAMQLYMLLAVEEGKGRVALADIAKRLCMDRTTASRNIRAVENKGLIKPRKMGDKRILCFELTDRGKQVREKGMELWGTAQEKASNHTVVPTDNLLEVLGDLSSMKIKTLSKKD